MMEEMTRKPVEEPAAEKMAVEKTAAERLTAENVEAEAYEAAKELLEAAKLAPGSILVVGCSTSEVRGSRIGTDSAPETGRVLLEAIAAELEPRGIRSLTRSVWADDGVDGTLFYRDIHAGQCRKTAKVFTDGMGLKNSVCHTISPFLRPSKRPGLFCPCGPCKNFATA